MLKTATISTTSPHFFLLAWHSVTPYQITVLNFYKSPSALTPDSQGLDKPIFISIDMEYLSNLKQDSSQNLNSQVGVAILDSRHLISSPPRTAISTYNFVTGSPSYCAATTKKFLFDKTVAIHQRDILSNLESLLPRTRNIILVGHEFKNDLQVLQLLDFNLHTSIRGILDVGRIASKIIPNIPMRLSSILSELGCPFQNLHTAGNDAYFTLRVLLLLAIRDYPEEEVNSNHQEILSALNAITNVSIPRKSDPHLKIIKNIKKKQRRFQKNRKHQSKSWDIETQEQIRAERAARRVKNDSNDVGLEDSVCHE